MRTFKRDYYTLINRVSNVVIKKFPKNNLHELIYNSFKNIYNYDVNKKLPNLHRWCNSTSERYKNSCNWEKKLENAMMDNCYSK